MKDLDFAEWCDINVSLLYLGSIQFKS